MVFIQSGTIFVYILSKSICQQCLHKDLVFINRQLMSALASLEGFGEEDLVFKHYCIIVL